MRPRAHNNIRKYRALLKCLSQLSLLFVVHCFKHFLYRQSVIFLKRSTYSQLRYSRTIFRIHKKRSGQNTPEISPQSADAMDVFKKRLQEGNHQGWKIIQAILADRRKYTGNKGILKRVAETCLGCNCSKVCALLTTQSTIYKSWRFVVIPSALRILLVIFQFLFGENKSMLLAVRDRNVFCTSHGFSKHDIHRTWNFDYISLLLRTLFMLISLKSYFVQILLQFILNL